MLKFIAGFFRCFFTRPQPEQPRPLQEGQYRYGAGSIVQIKRDAHDRYIPCSAPFLPSNADIHSFVSHQLSQPELVRNPSAWLEKEIRLMLEDPDAYIASVWPALVIQDTSGRPVRDFFWSALQNLRKSGGY